MSYVAKLRKWSNYSALHRFDVLTIKTFELRRKTTKVIKLQWIASIWHQNNPKCWDTSQNIQNNANQRKSSNYNAWHRFDVLTIKTFELRRKTTKDQIIVHCIDLTSKRSKTFEIRRKTFKTAKLRKWSNYSALHRFYIKTIQNVEIRRKTFKTTQTNESDQIIMHGIDLTSKRSKHLSYVAKLRKWSNYSALHRFHVKTI